MPRKKLGTFGLGYLTVNLYVDPRTSAAEVSADTLLDPESDPKKLKQLDMTIGIGGGLNWPQVLGHLVHEIQEALMEYMLQVGYRQNTVWKSFSSDKLFIFSHVQFEHMNTYLGFFLAEALPLVKKEFDDAG